MESTPRLGHLQRLLVIIGLVAAIAANTAVVKPPAAHAAVPPIDATCLSYPGGAITVNTQSTNHLIFVIVEKYTSSGWKEIALSQVFEWKKTKFLTDYWKNPLGAGYYRVKGWTWDYRIGKAEAFKASNVSYKNSLGYFNTAFTGRNYCWIS